MTSKIYTNKDFENKLLSIREKLADLEHEQWSHWTLYLTRNFTKENILRWEKQIETKYSNLTEKEKNSDREWADKVLNLLRKEFEDLIYFAEDKNE